MKDAQPSPVRETSAAPSDASTPDTAGALGLVTALRATGRGIVILAGPSSCGKGAIAEVLRRTLQLPERNHVSMGEALRETIDLANKDARFRSRLGRDYDIHDDRCIFDPACNDPAVVQKALANREALTARYGESPSQVDWLEYCVGAGLLVPDHWSENLIEGTIRDRAEHPKAVILLDGYPRTEVASEHVLRMSRDFDIPIIKVIHLSVSKREMERRALGRNRADDTPEMLERRYQFYVEQVQPAVERIKSELGSHIAALIDAHQPAYDRETGELDLQRSVNNVARSVLEALGVSREITGRLESLG